MSPEGKAVPNSLIACDGAGCHVVNWNNRQTTLTLKQPQQFSVAKELKTFETFVTIRDMKKDKVLEELKYKMEHFANGEGKPIILIYGGVGVGKTHILSAILRVVAAQNVPARLYKAPDMFAWLKQGFDDKVDTYDNRKKFVKELTYLLIDDIKAERMSDWEWEQLESIFDYRSKQDILPTVFSSNNDKSDMSFRLIDRFTDKSMCEVIKLDLPSYRGLKK